MKELGTINEIVQSLNDKYKELKFKHTRRDNVDYIWASGDIEASIQFTYEEDINGRIWLLSQFKKDEAFLNYNNCYVHCYEDLDLVLKRTLMELGLRKVEWMHDENSL